MKLPLLLLLLLCSTLLAAIVAFLYSKNTPLRIVELICKSEEYFGYCSIPDVDSANVDRKRQYACQRQDNVLINVNNLLSAARVSTDGAACIAM